MPRNIDLPSPWPQKGDRLIGSNGEWHLNAWISGRTDLLAHIEGYKLAADLIYTRIDTPPRVAGFVHLVFPMVFLYRHFVELSIKDIISLGQYLDADNDKYPQNHNLAALWRDARLLLERVGPGCTDDDLDAMTGMVSQLDALDPGSFAFRYPVTKDWKPSLSPATEFSLAQFRQGIEKMAVFFEGARMMLSVYRDTKDSL